jgi:hypothetical protein
MRLVQRRTGHKRTTLLTSGKAHTSRLQMVTFHLPILALPVRSPGSSCSSPPTKSLSNCCRESTRERSSPSEVRCHHLLADPVVAHHQDPHPAQPLGLHCLELQGAAALHSCPGNGQLDIELRGMQDGDKMTPRTTTKRRDRSRA